MSDRSVRRLGAASFVASAALACTLAAVSAATTNEAPPPTGFIYKPTALGERATYAYTSDTTRTSIVRHSAGTVTFLRGERDTMEIDLTPEAGDPATYQGVVTANGTLGIPAIDNPREDLFVIDRMNEMIAMMFKAPASPKAGDVWQADEIVPLPLGQIAHIPTTVKVMSSDDGGFNLIASGSKHQELNSANGGGIIPLDLVYGATAHYDGHTFSNATGTLESTVEVVQQFTITSKWTLALKP